MVLHPTLPNVYIYHPGNFWDGPTHVEYDPGSGTFLFNTYGGPQRFPLIGPLK